ncbi:hypothetical protein D3C75_1018650 [compost metagenome]
MPAEGVQPSEDAGNLVLDFLMADDLARHCAVAVLEAVGDYQDAVTAGALRRLDDEIAATADDLVELLDLFFGLDDAVHFRHMDAGRQCALLGDDLVVDDRVQVALVVLQHVVRVAPVDTHDAPGLQGFPRLDQAKHQASAFFRNALKRTSSVRR